MELDVVDMDIPLDPSRLDTEGIANIKLELEIPTLIAPEPDTVREADILALVVAPVVFPVAYRLMAAGVVGGAEIMV